MLVLLPLLAALSAERLAQLTADEAYLGRTTNWSEAQRPIVERVFSIRTALWRECMDRGIAELTASNEPLDHIATAAISGCGSEQDNLRTTYLHMAYS